MKSKIALLLIFMATAIASYGQKIVVISGNLSPIKAEKVLNLKYSYDNLLVGKTNESEYINKKVTEYNSDEAGKGDKWKEAWTGDRKSRYEPKFEELFNKYLADAGKTAEEGASGAKYTIIIKTTMIEPGFNVGVVRKNASINVSIDVVETLNSSNCISKMSVKNVPGADAMGFDFDSGMRISEAYAKLGKAFGKYVIKNTK